MDSIKPFSHDPDELLRLVVTSASQGHRLYRLGAELKQDFVNMYENRHGIQVGALVQRAFIILDWYFFLRALHHNGVRPSVGHHRPPCQLYKRGILGSYYNKQIIVYSHLPCGAEACTRERLLSTLIHEMVHAYLHMFSRPKLFAEKVGSNRAHGAPWNALYHTITNALSQWPCVSGGFGGVADGQGFSSYVYSFETLEYPMEDDPASDDEEDRRFQVALSDAVDYKQNEAPLTDENENLGNAIAAAALPPDGREVTGRRVDTTNWMTRLVERLRYLVVMPIMDIVERMTNIK